MSCGTHVAHMSSEKYLILSLHELGALALLPHFSFLGDVLTTKKIGWVLKGKGLWVHTRMLWLDWQHVLHPTTLSTWSTKKALQPHWNSSQGMCLKVMLVGILLCYICTYFIVYNIWLILFLSLLFLYLLKGYFFIITP